MPGGDQQRIARQEEADQQSGLGEDDRGDQRQAADAHQTLHVVNLVEEVHQVLHVATTLGQAGAFVD